MTTSLIFRYASLSLEKYMFQEKQERSIQTVKALRKVTILEVPILPIYFNVISRSQAPAIDLLYLLLKTAALNKVENIMMSQNCSSDTNLIKDCEHKCVLNQYQSRE